MTVSGDFLVAFAMVAVLGLGLAVFGLYRQRTLQPVTEATLAQRYADLTATVNTLRRQLDEADVRIRSLEGRVQELEAENAQLRARVAPDAPRLPVKPLLVIGGTDSDVFERDRHALRRAGVAFHRLVKATKPAIAAELRRRRQDGSLYPWLLVSAHAGAGGVALVDGFAGPDWWHDQLDGIQVVVLAVCAGGDIADELAGLVDAVVWFAEAVPNEDAANFNYVFFQALLGGADVRDAFAAAMSKVPQVAEYVDIRTA